MNRAEFMRRLTGLLGDVPPTEREEAIQYYNDYFDDAGAENESSVIASLGSPEELARSIKAGLNDGGGSGEFTETGFSGYTQAHKDEMIRAGEMGTGGSAAGQENTGGSNGRGNNAQNNNSYYQGGYYQRSGDGVYSGREDTRKYQNPYEQNGSNYSYHDAAGGSSANAQGSAAGGSAGSAAGGNYNYTQPKKGMSGGTIAVIVILAVLTSPVWIGLLGGVFGVAVGLLAALAVIFLAFLVVGVALIVASFALLITGVAMVFSVPLGGVCLVGSSLIVFSVGLVFVWLMVLMAGTAIPAFVRGVCSLCRRLFGKGGVHA
ncbi:MAG: DUF1700 domain-containing protein [Eubacterium sp.]|nr:DUF1700 domain-containing protein [Eubacterium sp.]